MKRLPPLHELDPARMAGVEEISARPIFEELFSEIVATAPWDASASTDPALPMASLPPAHLNRSTKQRLRPRWVLIVCAAALVVLATVVPITLTSGNRQSGTSPHGSSPEGTFASPSWRLTARVVEPGWTADSQSASTHPESITCSSTTDCFLTVWDLASPHGPCRGTTPSAERRCFIASLGSVRLEVSHDGGTTWKRSLSLPIWSNLGPSVSCPSANTCLVLDGIGQNQGTLYTTTDEGGAWTSLAMPSAGYGNGGDLSCATASFCVATAATAIGPLANGEPGFEGSLEVTHNGGRSWSESALPGSFSVSNVDCFSADRCVVTGQSTTVSRVLGLSATAEAAALYTTDAGRTWIQASVPHADAAIWALSCVDSHCMAIGQGSRVSGGIATSSVVLQSGDGGETWSNAAEPPTEGTLSLDAVSCGSTDSCWVAGSSTGKSSAVMFSTTDDGVEWSSERLPTPGGKMLNYIRAIECRASGCLAIAQEPSSSVPSGSGGANPPPPLLFVLSDVPPSR